MVAAIGLVIRDLRPNSNEWRFWFWAGITLAAADFAFVLS